MKKLALENYFLPYQRRWVKDKSSLKIAEKGRQIGLTHADAYDSVRKCVGLFGRPEDVWVSSRDAVTARQYLRVAGAWVKRMDASANHLGLRILEPGKKLTAFVLRFASGKCIFSLSSSPDALVGKTGHIKLDEFAAHADQKELFRIAKPCTTWGCQLSIISTHRRVDSTFNELLKGIKHDGNPMSWSHHRISLQNAVDQGLVETINKVTGGNESRERFMGRMRAECIDEEQWQREYCCNPTDGKTSFITLAMVELCTDEALKVETVPFCGFSGSWYVGVDVGRKDHLFVMDVGEKVGDVLWDRARIELRGATFDQMESALWTVLACQGMTRCCVDATGLGMQLAERAAKKFGSRVEPMTFTVATKEAMAYELFRAFESGRVRIPFDGKLRVDLMGIKKTVSASGYIQFAGESDDSHCDRFWAKAMRQYAARDFPEVGAYVVK